jgi:hypothetical protein
MNDDAASASGGTSDAAPDPGRSSHGIGDMLVQLAVLGVGAFFAFQKFRHGSSAVRTSVPAAPAWDRGAARPLPSFPPGTYHPARWHQEDEQIRDARRQDEIRQQQIRDDQRQDEIRQQHIRDAHRQDEIRQQQMRDAHRR